MPRCPKHPEKEMVRCNSGVEKRGSGWNVYQAYFEDYICPTCGFRLRSYFLIMDVGR
jgi:hypothetical protein